MILKGDSQGGFSYREEKILHRRKNFYKRKKEKESFSRRDDCISGGYPFSVICQIRLTIFVVWPAPSVPFGSRIFRRRTIHRKKKKNLTSFDLT